MSSDSPAAPLAESLQRIQEALGGVSKKALELQIHPEPYVRLLDNATRGEDLISEKYWAETLSWARQLPGDLELDLLWADIQSQVRLGKRRGGAESVAGSPDLIGISAFNFDFIVPRWAGSQNLEGFRGFTTDPEWLLTSRDQVVMEADRIRNERPRSTAHPTFVEEFGGSTFSTVRMFLGTGYGLRADLIGVSGAPPVDSPLPRHSDFARRELDVDGIFLVDAPALAGQCISVVRTRGQDVRREMGTWPGANTDLFALLVRSFWPIVDYVSGARLLHLSSYFDERSPAVIAELAAQAVGASSGALKVAFDPGHRWSTAAAGVDREAVRRILESSTMLFVNEEELEEIARNYGSGVDLSAEEHDYANSILPRLKPSNANVIVVKHRGACSIYTHDGLESSPEIEPVRQVRDDTGAGDTFAGGFLAAYLASGADLEFAARVGLNLAREKLVTVGHPSAQRLRTIAGAVFREDAADA